MNLSNKVAIVTGAASGLGYATCKILAESGARVFGVDVNEKNLRKLQTELGDKAATRVTDVSDENSVREAIDAAVARFGALSVYPFLVYTVSLLVKCLTCKS